MPPDAESLERGTHRSDWTIAAHGCNSVVDDVIRNAVTNPATGPGGRLETVALEIRVPLRDDNPPRSGVNHVVVGAERGWSLIGGYCLSGRINPKDRARASPITSAR
jgi:hypothetical protein